MPLLALLALLVLLGLGGCASVRRDVPRPESSAWDKPAETVIGRALEQHITPPAGQSGFYLIESGLDALRIRAELADNAQRSLDLQYYALHEDATTQLLIWRVLRAAGRGVRVRLLLDDLYAAGRDFDLATLAAHPNVEVRVFNPFMRRGGWALSRLFEFMGDSTRLNRRMHNKLWIADNAAAIIGGRNIGDEYFEANPAVNFSDLDLLAAGGVVRELSSSFDEYWNSEWSVPVAAFLDGLPGPEALAAFQRRLESRLLAFRDTVYAGALRETRLLSRLMEGRLALTSAPAIAFFDKPDKIGATDTGTSNPIFQAHLRPAIESAMREVILVSPYFIPSEQGVGMLAGLVKRGVRVRILTNSLAATDVPIVHAGYARVRVRLLAAGVELHEMLPNTGMAERPRWLPGQSSGTSLHAKAIIIDGRRIFTGSMNLDPRSRLHNTEVGVLVDSTTLGSRLASVFDEAMGPAHSFQLRLERSEGRQAQLVWLTEKNGKRIVHTEEPAGFWRRFISKVLGGLAPDELL